MWTARFPRGLFSFTSFSLKYKPVASFKKNTIHFLYIQLYSWHDRDRKPHHILSLFGTGARMRLICHRWLQFYSLLSRSYNACPGQNSSGCEGGKKNGVSVIWSADTAVMPDREAAQFNAVWPWQSVIWRIANATARPLVHIDVATDLKLCPTRVIKSLTNWRQRGGGGETGHRAESDACQERSIAVLLYGFAIGRST